MALKVFVDFDGTVTEADVGSAFFLRFGGDVCAALVEEYRGGEDHCSENASVVRSLAIGRPESPGARRIPGVTVH